MRKNGFSLVELSIVLVILGLLVGGVLAGKSLIRASELRHITNEFSTIVTAAGSFRAKYQLLPGDLNNATQFWGAAAAPAACATAPTSGTIPTCNGNGDGKIAIVNYQPDGTFGGHLLLTTNSAGDTTFERAMFWQQLTNAGLGNYSFSNDKSNTTARTATWEVVDLGQRYVYATGGAQRPRRFNGNYGNSLIAAGIGTTSAGGYIAPVTPEEIWNIDMKLDDGKPATGNVVVGSTPVSTLGMEPCTTVTSSATLTADYLLTSSTKSCAIIFRNVF